MTREAEEGREKSPMRQNRRRPEGEQEEVEAGERFNSPNSKISKQTTNFKSHKKRDEPIQIDDLINFKFVQAKKKVKVFYVKRSASSNRLKLRKLSILANGQARQSAATRLIEQLGLDGQCELDSLVKTLESHLSRLRRARPKNLLIFVNPHGGKGRAVSIFKRYVKPVLVLAQVEYKLIVTQYANHAREMIEDPAFPVGQFDGMVGVGGDGMFSELMNGLLFRFNNLFDDNFDDTNNDHSKQQSQLQSMGYSDNATSAFKSPQIPIGIISAGSTDANSFGLIGTNDVVTSTLNIILANQIKIDVCSLHSYHTDRLLRFASTFAAYGYFGDVVRESEKLRWLGPSRYDLTGFNNLLKHRTYNGHLRILVSDSDGSPQDQDRCHKDCEVCHSSSAQTMASPSSSISSPSPSPSSSSLDGDQQDDHYQADQGEPQQCDDVSSSSSGSTCCMENEPDIPTKINQNSQSQTCNRISQSNATSTTRPRVDKDTKLKLIEMDGPFVGVNAAVTACRCPQTRKGFSPSQHLGNGCADLIVVRRCSRFQYLRYLLRTGYLKKSPFDLSYVEAFRCREFEFIVSEDDSISSSSERRSMQDENSSSSGNQNSNSDSMDKDRLGAAFSSASFASSPHHISRSGRTGGNSSSWNVDGEILANECSIRVRVNNKLLNVYGTGEPIAM